MYTVNTAKRPGLLNRGLLNDRLISAPSFRRSFHCDVRQGQTEISAKEPQVEVLHKLEHQHVCVFFLQMSLWNMPRTKVHHAKNNIFHRREKEVRTCTDNLSSDRKIIMEMIIILKNPLYCDMVGWRATLELRFVRVCGQTLIVHPILVLSESFGVSDLCRSRAGCRTWKL